jgi:hypothetical protein
MGSSHRPSRMGGPNVVAASPGWCVAHPTNHTPQRAGPTPKYATDLVSTVDQRGGLLIFAECVKVKQFIVGSYDSASGDCRRWKYTERW